VYLHTFRIPIICSHRVVFCGILFSCIEFTLFGNKWKIFHIQCVYTWLYISCNKLHQNILVFFLATWKLNMIVSFCFIDNIFSEVGTFNSLVGTGDGNTKSMKIHKG